MVYTIYANNTNGTYIIDTNGQVDESGQMFTELSTALEVESANLDGWDSVWIEITDENDPDTIIETIIVK